MLAVRIAFPHVERRAPVAVAREGPVDVVLKPFAEAAGAHLGRMPIDLSIDLQHPCFHRSGADEPGAAGVVDQRRIAAPTMRIAVRVGSGLEPAAVVLQPVDDQMIRFFGRDELAFELRPAIADAAEGAVGAAPVSESTRAVRMGPGLRGPGDPTGRHRGPRVANPRGPRRERPAYGNNA